MAVFDKQQIRRLLKGASLLTTGGGLCNADQCRSLDKYRSIEIGLRDLNDFAAGDVLVTAAEVGPASAPEINKELILPAMIDAWKRLTGKEVKGVYPPELGQEMIVIDTAHALGVPLADFDPAGGRAVPLVDISSLTLAGVDFSLSPLVLATDRGEIVALDTPVMPERAEEFLRTMTALSKDGIVYFIGGAVRAGDIQGKGIDNRSLSLAYDIGSAVNTDSLAAKLLPDLVIRGRVTQKAELQREGFNCYTAIFAAENGEQYSLYILNEVLFIRSKDGDIVGAAPDKILLVDEEAMAGLSTAELLSGRQATLMIVRADPLWRSDKAQALFGPARFPFLLAA